MAKKNSSPKSKRLTDDQIRQLANRMVAHGGNVYAVAAEMFPDCEFECDTEESSGDWGRLETVGDVFKCLECDEWLTVSEREPRMDFCRNCIDEIDGNDDDEFID